MGEPEPESTGLRKVSTRSLSFHDSVGRIVVKGEEGSNARAVRTVSLLCVRARSPSLSCSLSPSSILPQARLRATTSTHFKTMLNPQNRSMLRKIEKQKADQKLQAKQLADLQRKLEKEARVVDATISAHDLTERGEACSLHLPLPPFSLLRAR